MNKYVKLPYDDSEIKNFSAKEIIAEAGKEKREAGMIIDGYAFLESIDHDGVRRILDIYRPGNVFVESFFPVSSLESIYLISRSKCSAVMFELRDDLKINEDIIFNEETLTFEKIYLETQKRQLAHIHILGQHTLRQKIMAFFEYVREERKTNKFKMNISLSDAADYIGADRSAMMRELKKMTDDGLVRHKGKDIELLYLS